MQYLASDEEIGREVANVTFETLTHWEKCILSAYLRRKIREHAVYSGAVSPDYHPAKAVKIAKRWPIITAVRYEVKSIAG